MEAGEAKSRKPRRPTLKQKAFAEEYVANGGNGLQAALVTYDTDDPATAGAIASENLNKPHVQSLVDSVSERMRCDFSAAFGKALAHINRMFDADDSEERDKALAWCKDVAKAFAPQSPKNVHDNRKQSVFFPPRVAPKS